MLTQSYSMPLAFSTRRALCNMSLSLQSKIFTDKEKHRMDYVVDSSEFTVPVHKDRISCCRDEWYPLFELVFRILSKSESFFSLKRQLLAIWMQLAELKLCSVTSAQQIEQLFTSGNFMPDCSCNLVPRVSLLWRWWWKGAACHFCLSAYT